MFHPAFCARLRLTVSTPRLAALRRYPCTVAFNSHATLSQSTNETPWWVGLLRSQLSANMFLGGLLFDMKDCLRSVAGGLLPARFGTTLLDETFTPSVFRSFLFYVKERLRPAVRGLLPARFGTTLSPNLHVLALSGGRASSSRFVTNLSKQSYTCHHCSEVFCFARKNPAMKHVKHQHPNPCSSFEAFPLAVSRRIYLPP